MTDNIQENPQGSEQDAPVDRREAAKTIAKYVAYTAPAMAVLLDSDDADAGGRRHRRRRNHRRRNHRRGHRRRWRSPKAS